MQTKPSSCKSLVSIHDLRIGGPWFVPRLLRIDDSHCDSIHSSLTAEYCVHDGYVGK